MAMMLLDISGNLTRREQRQLLIGLLQVIISNTDSLYLPHRLTFSHAGFSTLSRGTEKRRGWYTV